MVPGGGSSVDCLEINNISHTALTIIHNSSSHLWFCCWCVSSEGGRGRQRESSVSLKWICLLSAPPPVSVGVSGVWGPQRLGGTLYHGTCSLMVSVCLKLSCLRGGRSTLSEESCHRKIIFTPGTQRAFFLTVVLLWLSTKRSAINIFWLHFPTFPTSFQHL